MLQVNSSRIVLSFTHSKWVLNAYDECSRDEMESLPLFGSAGEDQADERARVAWLSWRVSGR